MAIETKHNLNDKTIETLQDLIQVNIDAKKGFEEAADALDDVNLTSLFEKLSAERGKQATELQTLVAHNSEKPTTEGSYSGSAHRAWMNLKSSLGAGNQMVLNEAERGEDHIKAKYEDALKCCAGSAVTDVLNRQYASVKQAHDRVRDLRDSYQD